MSLFITALTTLLAGPCPANARMLRSSAKIQHILNDPLQISQHLEGQTMSNLSFESSGISIVLHGVLGCAGLAFFVLLLSCLHDVAKQWQHRSHFRACKRKVQRVHEVLERSSGELPLCPCCLEFVPSKASRSAVVFLCGHRFHVECANRWMHEHGATTGPGEDACPLCQSCSTDDVCGPGAGSGQVGAQETDGTVLGQPDEFKPFILRSLSKKYPDIIREDCVKRWCKCHTELWLSELSCPHYSSIFQAKQIR